MKILIRFDDICPTMNYEQFLIAVNEMDKRQIKPLIGVVPNCLDPDLKIDIPHADFWTFIKELQGKGYIVAMHGYQHVFDNHCRGSVVTRYDSEFAGHSIDVQIEKIRRGKEILESHGIHTDIFFAPGHSYDTNTLKALATCGFKYMSDGKSFKPYEKHGIKCIPCRSGGVPKMRYGTYHTAVFHAHEWAWENKKYCYEEFIKLLDNKSLEFVDFYTFSHQNYGIKCIQEFDEKIYVFNERYIRPLLSKIRGML